MKRNKKQAAIHLAVYLLFIKTRISLISQKAFCKDPAAGLRKPECDS